MNESSYTSTILYAILEATVSSDVESEQIYIIYISTAVLFVTGLTTRLSSTNRNSFVYIGS